MGRLRYPGVKPFTRHERETFFGRSQDIERLSSLIRLEQLVVLYGKSGLGKSSLLHAGVLPLLEEKSGYRCHIIRFGAHSKYSASPLQKTYDTLSANTGERQFLEMKPSLWQGLKKGRGSGLERVLLVFDQFEELFTYPEEEQLAFQYQLSEAMYSEVPAEIREWMAEMGTALSDEERRDILEPLNVEVLFSIRSDRMSLLNQMKGFFPAVLKNCYELQPLSRKDAEDAILLPAYYQGEFDTPPFDYSDEALDNILDFLTNGGQQQVEGFTLQVICQYAEKLVKEAKVAKPSKGMPTIENGQLGDLEEIYAGYYTQLIQQLGDQDTQLRLRKLIEEELIFEEEERRISLDESILSQRMGFSQDMLKKMVDSHLLRVEISSTGGRSYEVSHDALVAPILKAKAERQEGTRKKRQRRQWLVFGAVSLLLITLIGIGANYYIEQQRQTMNEVYGELGTALGIPEEQLEELRQEEADPAKQLKAIVEQASKTIEVTAKKDSIFQRATEQMRAQLQDQAKSRTEKQLASEVLKALDAYETAAQKIEEELPSLVKGKGQQSKGSVSTDTTQIKNEEGTEQTSGNDHAYEKHRREGDQMLEAGYYAKALAAYEMALTHHPEDAYAKQQISRCRQLIEEWQEQEEAVAKKEAEKQKQEEQKAKKEQEKAVVKTTEEPSPTYDFTVNGVSFKMVDVQGGIFDIGCTDEQGNDCEQDEKPTLPVTLDSYQMGQTEVTQELWRAVMGSDPPKLTFDGCDQCPVEKVSWIDVQEFIGRLNRLTGKSFRLPTEAEWEYAAKGGHLAKPTKYAGSNSIDEVAWYDKNSLGRARPVAQKKPNELGLYDMSGNIMEWCRDWYDAGYTPKVNPQGPQRGKERSARGGSWYNNASLARTSNRENAYPSFRFSSLGFRLALTP